MLRNFRQVFKGNQTPTAIIMLAVALSMLAYLAPSQGAAEAPDSVVARVYGRDILKRDLDEAMGQMAQRLGKQANLEQMLPFLKAQAYREVLSQRLSEELAERHGVVVTDLEVKERLVAMLKAYPAFLNPDGSLRATAEVEQILRANGQGLSQLERGIRAELVHAKLRRQMAAVVPMDEATLLLAHRAKSEKLSFEAVSLSPEPAAVADPGDAKLDAFLKEGGARFQTGPRRVLQVVALTTASLGEAGKVDDAAVRTAYEARKSDLTQMPPRHILFKASGEAELAKAQQKAEAALARLKAGTSFTALADELTEDPSGKGRGGLLEGYRPGAFVKPFEDALLALKPGETSGPVKTEFGVHLIQRSVKPLEEVQEALRAELGRERFASKAKDRLEALRKRAGDHGDLVPAARALSLKVETTLPFSEGGPLEIPGLGPAPGLLRDAFQLKVGAVSKLQQQGDGYLVYRVVEEKPVGVPPLAEIRGTVLEAYRLEEARKALSAKTSELLKGGDLAAAGTATPQTETTLEALGEAGQHPAVRKALLGTAVGSLTPLVWNAEGKLWVARITARVPAPALTFEARRELVQKLQDAGAERTLGAELQDLNSKGLLRPGLSSLWGRWNGIWQNPKAAGKSALDLD